MIFFAYFDPGSGGYLFSSILAWVGGGLALGSALIIHFFKNVLVKRAAGLWKRRRGLVLLITSVLLAAAVMAGMWIARHPSSHGGLVPIPPAADVSS